MMYVLYDGNKKQNKKDKKREGLERSFPLPLTLTRKVAWLKKPREHWAQVFLGSNLLATPTGFCKKNIHRNNQPTAQQLIKDRDVKTYTPFSDSVPLNNIVVKDNYNVVRF